MREFTEAFVHNADGSWTCIVAATLEDRSTRRVQVIPGARFFRGNTFMNIDLAALLDKLVAAR